MRPRHAAARALRTLRILGPARTTVRKEGSPDTTTDRKAGSRYASRRRQARRLGAETVALSEVDTAAVPVRGEVRRNDLARYAYVLGRVTGSLLDVGCGNGVFLDAYEGGPKAGVDLKPPADRGWPSYVGDAAALPFADGSWDTVSAQEMLEHQPDDRVDLVLSELRRVARERLLVTVPFCQRNLRSGHLQRFDAARLRASFPTARFTILDKGGGYPWVLIEETYPTEGAVTVPRG